MYLEFLKALSKRPLPQIVFEPEEVRQLQVLFLNGFVQARIPREKNSAAVATAITDKGLAFLTVYSDMFGENYGGDESSNRLAPHPPTTRLRHWR